MLLGGGNDGPWRRLRLAAALRRAALCAIAVLALPGDASGVVNPHDTTKPRFCLNCHTEDIYAKDCDENEGYCLLGGSVDGICMICHLREDCCTPGKEHLPKLHIGQRTHPSDVQVREIPRAYYPRTLPIHNGRITCRTCHRHVRDPENGYKMLRLVTITAKGVDWAVLCQDCHKDR